MKRRATFIEAILVEGIFGQDCEWLTFEGVLIEDQHPLSPSQIADLIAAGLWPASQNRRLPERPSLAPGGWRFCMDVVIAGSRYRLMHDLTHRTSVLSLQDEPDRENIEGREAVEAFLSARMMVPAPPPPGASGTALLQWLTRAGLLVLGERVRLEGRDRYVPLRLLHCDAFTRTDLAFDLRLQRHVRFRALRAPWIRHPEAVEAFLERGHHQARAGELLLALHDLDSDEAGPWHILATGPGTRSSIGETDWSGLYDSELIDVLERCADVMTECEIVHGRLEPHSFLFGSGRAFLVDSGIAWAIQRAVPRDALELAPPSAWAAPELASGGEPSVRSDIYSLGLIFKSILASLPRKDTEWMLQSPRQVLERMVEEEPEERPPFWSRVGSCM